MLFVAGAALISAALLLVVVARREANRPGAPGWLQAAVLGNGVALAATTMLACGAGLLMQAAVNRGDALGAAGAVIALLLPFAGLWLLARRRVPKAADAAMLPPTAGGSPRRGRPGARPATAADGGVAARRTG